MIKIAICDDERELREATAARLREYFAEEALIAPLKAGKHCCARCGRRTAATSWRCWILSWER